MMKLNFETYARKPQMVQPSKDVDLRFIVRCIPRQFVQHTRQAVLVDSRIIDLIDTAEEYDLTLTEVIRIRIEQAEAGLETEHQSLNISLYPAFCRNVYRKPRRWHDNCITSLGQGHCLPTLLIASDCVHPQQHANHCFIMLNTNIADVCKIPTSSYDTAFCGHPHSNLLVC